MPGVIAQPPSSSPLARYLFVAYAALIVYASLHPWSGWRAYGVNPFAFVTAAWPKYRTWFDTLTNLVAYVPLGALGVAALLPMRRWQAFALAVSGGVLLSFAMEALQTYLPTRVSSNLDFALNAAGAAAGGLLGVWLAPWAIATGRAWTLRDRWLERSQRTDFGLVLLGLWLLTQLYPGTLLFGTGDLRELIGALPSKPYPAELFVRVEALVAGTNLAAIALITAGLVSPERPGWLPALLLFLIALSIRSLAFAVLLDPGNSFNWFTPGAAIGLALGASIFVVAMGLSPRVQRGIAGVCTTVAAAVVNIGPENPYLADSLSAWRQGHFLNFNGLTRAVSAIWPFLAMAYLFAGDRRARERGP